MAKSLLGSEPSCLSWAPGGLLTSLSGNTSRPRGAAGCVLYNPRKRKEAASKWASYSQVPGPATYGQEL